MVKTTINDEWKNYIHKQIKHGVNIKKLEDVLKKQNYNYDIINALLYPDKIENNKVYFDVSNENPIIELTDSNDDNKITYIIYSENPIVKTYPDFLSDEECKCFIDISKENLKRALVSSNDKGVISQGRSGKNTWIKHNFNDITKNVSKRIAKIVGIPLENAEAFQIIHYDEKQEYRNHYDSWEHDNSEKTLRCMKYGGARLMTALCYLNYVEKGGGTRLSKLNITIPADKRKLLVFQNTMSKDNHNRHPLSEHAGMPVEVGEKYAFNLWFRECPINMLYKELNPDYYK